VTPLAREQVQIWLDAYIEAWKSYEPKAIEALYAADVICRYHPYDEPIVGREAVVESWLGEGDHAGAPGRDKPGTYTAEYSPVAVDGDVAVAVGSSRYAEEPGGPATEIYDNCFLLRFDDDGRCREYTEWFMKRPGP